MLQMQMKAIFFFSKICMCTKGPIFEFLAQHLLILSLPHFLAAKPTQFLCLQVSSSASPLVKTQITANSPTVMNGPKVTCQQMYPRWEMFLHVICNEIILRRFHKVYEYAKKERD